METRPRSLIRAIPWRICGSAATCGVVYALTGRGDAAVAAGAADSVIHLAIQFILDRAPATATDSPAPLVLWFTGLSGSGKSTLAQAVVERLRARGHRVESVDGDAVRGVLPNVGFGRDERNDHIRRVGFLASRLERNGVTVVASFVSPYRESRDFVRSLCRDFVEIHVATPLEECERRDVKGLYRKARAGELRAFTGIDDPYEAPVSPELRIDTTGLGLDEAAERVMRYLEGRRRAG